MIPRRQLARLFSPLHKSIFEDFNKEIAMMNKLFNEATKGSSAIVEGERNLPVEVAEHDNQVELIAELPGMTKDQVQVEVHDGNVLTLKGEYKIEMKEKPKYHYSERTMGKFERAFQFPDEYKLEGIKAQMKDGLLRLSIPKVNTKTGKRSIKIEENSEQSALPNTENSQ